MTSAYNKKGARVLVSRASKKRSKAGWGSRGHPKAKYIPEPKARRVRIGMKSVKKVVRESLRSVPRWGRCNPQKVTGRCLEKESKTRAKAKAVPGRRAGESQAQRPRRETPKTKGRRGVGRVGLGIRDGEKRRVRILPTPPKRRKLRARVRTVDP